ncbi:MAG TPA: M13 family metallopeptidase [Candidatus Didemnitutus sp.]|nr:M13 family metallopeptidase [Candidatus Didemnitutus sp.]
MKSVRLLLAAACGATLLHAAPKISCVDRAYMNLAASPGADFYTYACGAYDKVPIPPEYSAYGVNQEIDERNFAILRRILEASAAQPGAEGSVGQRIGDFYAAGMDEAAIEKSGLQPLADLLGRIDTVKDSRDLLPLLGDLLRHGINAGFNFGVQVDDKDSSAEIGSFYQGGLGLPERDFYFRTGTEAEDIRKAYVAHVARTLQLAGASADAAGREAATVMAFETKLAQASRTIVDLRDPEKNYNKFERAGLNKVAPGLAWEGFLGAIHFPASEKTVLVGQPEFFHAFDELVAHEPIDTWRTYLRWQVLLQTSDYLSHAFVDEHFSFFGVKLNGTTQLKPRWKRVLAATDGAIGEDLGQLYVKEAFSPAAKERALQMVHFHLEAMRQRIAAATWMSAETKKAAYAKIDAMRTKIGYPDHWRDYSTLHITRDSYVGNALAAATFELNRQLAKLGKPVDRTEWLMTPQTNNAYYEPTLNEMCFPAGILQPPFFDEGADDASNYGALASTIGHELTHGFDDQGRQYDAQGNLKNWWTDADAAGFQARAELVAKQYDAFEPLPGLHINGHQTLGENIADVGGLRVAYAAFHLATAGKRQPDIDGFTPEQRFFIAFAQGWRTNERPERVRTHVASDVHSPVRWRVIGPVANFPEFRAAFGLTGPAPTWDPIW